MAHKEKRRIEYIIIAVVILLGVLYFAYTQGFLGNSKLTQSEDMLQYELYDKAGVKLGSGSQAMFAIVNNIQNVEYARFKVVTKNAGDIPYTAKLVNAGPAQLYSAFGLPLNGQTVNADGEGVWTSGAVNMSVFGNASVNFSVSVDVNFESGKKITRSASLVLNIVQTSTGSNVTTNTSGGGGGGGGGSSETTLCTGIQCNPYCSGMHYRYGGYCKITFTNATGYRPDCYFDNITWYSPSCGWDYTTMIMCGDNYCNSAINSSSSKPYECCYVTAADEQYKCKSGAPLCETAENSCDPDCKQSNFVNWLPPIQLG